MFLVGCATTSDKKDWSACIPQNPPLQHVRFVRLDSGSLLIQEETIRVGEGFYLTNEEATKLANNIDELKTHIDKLETLVKEINEYDK